MTLPGLSIVIPSHNRPDLLTACLRSVRAHAPAGTHILVVDDASPGAAVSTAASAFPGIEIVRLDQCGGFCIAANTGIAAARQPIVELLNDDTEVCPGWAEAALHAFAEDRIGAVTPLVLRWPDAENSEASVDSAGDHYHVGGFATKRCHGQRLGVEHFRSRFVFGASASSAFYRRDLLLRLGAFPESFGAYFEDVDLAFRIHRAGYRIWYEPASRVMHHVSASHGSRPAAALCGSSRATRSWSTGATCRTRSCPCHCTFSSFSASPGVAGATGSCCPSCAADSPCSPRFPRCSATVAGCAGWADGSDGAIYEGMPSSTSPRALEIGPPASR
jgi:GT2 family glycosyltransferase